MNTTGTTTTYPRMFKDKFGSTRRWFVFEPDGDVWIRIYPDMGIQNINMVMRESDLSIEVTDEPFPDLFINDDFENDWRMQDGKPAQIYLPAMN